MNITEKKENKVAARFGEAAEYYHRNAEIQKKVAEGLMSSLVPWKDILPEGPILEVGCGTGFLTGKLIELFPQKELVVTDASEEMLRFCKKNLEAKRLNLDKITFELLEVDSGLNLEEHKFAMVISNFAAQWFKDPAMGLERLSESIKPGGLLLSSFPGNHSFSKWYELCLELGLPFTANPLPDVEGMVVKLSMGPLQIDYYENDLYEEFSSSLDFFRHLKNMGASENLLGKSLNSKQFRLLLNHWDNNSTEKIKVKWHIVYIAAKKDR